mmetsp:Transcript_22179/g.32252  ORF Transcript_22179/g.32252 Transcript_22179/m.32252 type:complete len:356 (+) Transcript_22179:305-1372(+)
MLRNIWTKSSRTIATCERNIFSSTESSSALWRTKTQNPKSSIQHIQKRPNKRLLTTSTSKTTEATTTDVLEPTTSQLRIVALHSGIPMIGFGFMDNLVMIQAGEAIDMSLGVAFSLSTLTAAGFGQCISDVAGFTCGGIVDATVAKMNLPTHGLSQVQLKLKPSRIATTVGGCVGVVFGCLLGMSCLLFMDTDRADRLKKEKELTSIFQSVMDEGHKLVNADRCALWMADETKKESDELWSRVVTGTNKKEIRVLKNVGSVVGTCFTTGEVINISDAYQDERFNKQVDAEFQYRTRSIVAVPVKNKEDGKVIAVIQMINKKKEDGSDGVFNDVDVKMIQMLASHVSHFVKVVTGS